jgi:hypothetical protein
MSLLWWIGDGGFRERYWRWGITVAFGIKEGRSTCRRVYICQYRNNGKVQLYRTSLFTSDSNYDVIRE